MPVLKYTGDHEREFPSIGVFRPGDEIEVAGEAAKSLLASGYFSKVKKKEGDQ